VAGIDRLACMMLLLLVQIDVKNLTEDAFWSKVHEDELEDSEIFEGLQENFSAKPPASTCCVLCDAPDLSISGLTPLFCLAAPITTPV